MITSLHPFSCCEAQAAAELPAARLSVLVPENLYRGVTQRRPDKLDIEVVHKD